MVNCRNLSVSSSIKCGFVQRVLSKVDEIMPPTMGAAMRRMTSEPTPVLHMIGSRPAMMAVMVIS